MSRLKSIGTLIVVVMAAWAGAAVADLARQQLAGAKGRVVFRTASGEWTVTTPPQILIPAVLGGLRFEQRGLLVAAGTAAILAANEVAGFGGRGRDASASEDAILLLTAACQPHPNHLHPLALSGE